MENLIKTLLLEGIDEDTIHRVLDVIEEEYEIIDEDIFSTIKKVHGEPEYNKETGEPINKSAELANKAQGNKSKEFGSSYMRDYENSDKKGPRQCTTSTETLFYKKRDNSKAKQNDFYQRRGTNQYNQERRNQLKQKHAELTNGKQGLNGINYKDFENEMRKAHISFTKNHSKKGGKGWK